MECFQFHPLSKFVTLSCYLFSFPGDFSLFWTVLRLEQVFFKTDHDAKELMNNARIIQFPDKFTAHNKILLFEEALNLLYSIPCKRCEPYLESKLRCRAHK